MELDGSGRRVDVTPGGGLPGYLERYAVHPNARPSEFGCGDNLPPSGVAQDIVQCLRDMQRGRRSDTTVTGVLARHPEMTPEEIAGASGHPLDGVEGVVGSLRKLGIVRAGIDPRGLTVFSLADADK